MLTHLGELLVRANLAGMRAIPTSFDSGVVAEIDRRLADVESDHGVTIPWCIESGSRAWGFPSPDSDYDCRFFFVRPVDDYLSLWPRRDVIETPLDEIFDVNGWDLRKAIRLLVDGNAVVNEWLRSPFVYRGQSSFHDDLLTLGEAVSDRAAVGRHYTHVGLKQWHRYGDPGDMQLKRFFYAIRPAASVRWLQSHPLSAAPPMDLPSLLRENQAPDTVQEAVAELIELKARTREMGSGAVSPVLMTYVEEALSFGQQHFESKPARDPSSVAGLADETFRHLVRTYGPRPARAVASPA